LTTEETIFLLDSNVFIEAKRRYYAFDIVPGFWTNLVQHADSGQLMSIDRVKHELELGQDELSHWVKHDFANGFASTNQSSVIGNYTDIIEWVNAEIQFLDAAKSDFARGADGWLVAYAKDRGYILVTHEQFNQDIKRKVPIPNVCQQFGVTCVDTFEMLRQLGVTFS